MYGLILILLLTFSAFIIYGGVKKQSKTVIALGVLSALIFIGFFISMDFWIDVLWFNALGFSHRFWAEILYMTASTIAGALLATIISYFLLYLIPTEKFKLLKLGTLLLLFLLGATWGYANWETFMQYWNKVPTVVTDPVFNLSVGFYLFTIPFLDAIFGLLFMVSFIALAVTFIAAFVRLTEQQVTFAGASLITADTKKLHSAIYLNASFFLLVLAFGKLLDKYHLMYSSQGIVFGPGWTDVNIVIPSYNIIVVIMILIGIALLIPSLRNKVASFFSRAKITRANAPIYILGSIFGSLILLWFLMLTLIPAGFAMFVVKPNEITYEKPFISNNIKFTRIGFGLDKIIEKEFPENGKFTMETVKNNPSIFNNIRLWDWRALDATYRQFQGFRLYYQFSNVDVDRYHVNGKYREIMVATREMNSKHLPKQSQTFVNNRFQYTHGYGITMATVNEFTSQGLPHLLIKNIPIESEAPELTVNQPRIYYGELTKTPVVVNSKEKEFDYPNGSDNVYTRYTGKGGVSFNGFWRKFLFSSKFDGTKLLFSDYPTDSSRLMFRRQIQERVETIAPFLKFDEDPYIVLDKGNLYWIIDAYTSSNYMPYSEPFSSQEVIPFKVGNSARNLVSYVDKEFNGANYIRNSVKITVNAFDGTVNFYIMDESDPIINVWSKIYPKMFKPKSEMSKELSAHIRYPKDMLRAQGMVYAKYHMTDPSVFYNQEDLWVRSTEKYYSSIQPVEPYHIIWQLPGSTKPEFSLILPFSPKNRQVLIGWIAGLCDEDNYGELIAYQFPKGKMITGSQQVETKIDQDSFLSGQLTLWDQRGSNVIRGNVLAIPVANTLFYVEPIYLQAETAAYPELRLVVVMHGDDMAYAKSFDKALQKLFNTTEKNSAQQTVSTSPSGKIQLPKELIEQANNAFNNYLKLSAEKRFSDAAKEMEKLENALNRLKTTVQK